MSVTALWSTRANALTLLRLLLAPALAAAVLHGARGLATCLFFLAVATDFADGWVARRYGETSAFGGFADHVVDAIFVTAGTAALACTGVVPGALPWLIALAFVQYTFDSRALVGPIRSPLGSASLRAGRLATGLRPSRLGRWNGIAYYAIVAIPIVRDALALGWPSPGLVMALGWTLVASTLVSMLDRFRTWLRARRH